MQMLCCPRSSNSGILSRSQKRTAQKRIIVKVVLEAFLLAGVLGLMLADRVLAQSNVTLYNFTSIPSPPGPFTNIDGAEPFAGLTESEGTLFGTAHIGGSSGNGTVFRIGIQGASFTNLHSFAGYPNDGGVPLGSLFLSDGILYGTAYGGGSLSNGTVFAVSTDGSGFTNLYEFTGSSDGASPSAGVIAQGSTLYGAAALGGSSGNGTLFKLNTDGSGFNVVHTFAAGSGTFPIVSNNEGAFPVGLILSGNTLYGTTQGGGTGGNGTVFRVNTDGSGFSVVHDFTPGSGPAAVVTNSDGAHPVAPVILSSNTLYGTTFWGGAGGYGTVFRVNDDGTQFKNLHSFTAPSSPGPATNYDGNSPNGGLVISANTLYGTTRFGGPWGDGTIFQLNTDGSGFGILDNFGSNGGRPVGSLILSSNILYGTTAIGGSWDSGTVFSLSLAPPKLTISLSGSSVILTWPANAARFALQSTTNLISQATWTPVFPLPVVVNGQNTVTNEISGTEQFYRLSQ